MNVVVVRRVAELGRVWRSWRHLVDRCSLEEDGCQSKKYITRYNPLLPFSGNYFPVSTADSISNRPQIQNIRRKFNRVIN
jgi:hypothetical protein